MAALLNDSSPRVSLKAARIVLGYAYGLPRQSAAVSNHESISSLGGPHRSSEVHQLREGRFGCSPCLPGLWSSHRAAGYSAAGAAPAGPPSSWDSCSAPPAAAAAPRRSRSLRAVSIAFGIIFGLALLGRLIPETKARTTNVKAPGPKGISQRPLDARKARLAAGTTPADIERGKMRAASRKAEEAREAERKRQDGIKGRELFATKILDRTFLTLGRDVGISVEGKQNTVLRLRWVLWSRVTIFQMQNDQEFMKSLRAIGFKRIIFETGYGYSWTLGVGLLRLRLGGAKTA